MKAKNKTVVTIFTLIFAVASVFMVTSFADKQEYTNPTVYVEDSYVELGTNIATVKVNVINNIGIGGTSLTVSYDEDIELVSAENGSLLAELNYTSPETYSSPCKFLWDGQSSMVSDDGTMLKLNFDISNINEAREINIFIAISEGGIYGIETETVPFDVISGKIIIEDNSECAEHTWDEPVVIWEDDGSFATATRNCTKCGAPETADVMISYETSENATCNKEGRVICTAIITFDDNSQVTAQKIVSTPTSNHIDSNNDGKCDDCNTVVDQNKYDEYLINNQIAFKVPNGRTVDYRSKVIVNVSAENAPEGYSVAIYEGNTKQASGNNSASYTSGELKDNVTYTAKLYNSKNEEIKSVDINIKVNMGFFAKLIAFFRGLFGMLPNITL